MFYTKEANPCIVTHLAGSHAQSPGQPALCLVSVGPSDSEGAVVKLFLRRLAFVNNKRANSSEDAYGYCVGEEGRGLVGVQKPKQKKRHSIMSRAFYYVPVGEVDHLTRLELGSVEGIKSHFCFIGSSGSEGELELVERSCFEC